MSRFVAAVALLLCVASASAVVVRQGNLSMNATTSPSTTNATSAANKTNGSTTTNSSGNSSNSSNSSCFPADATVVTFAGAVKRMDELIAGDRVHVGRGQFSEVFMFTHKTAEIRSEFVVIDAAVSGAQLRVSPGHYIYVNGALAAASSVVAGDKIELADGSVDTVATVSSAVFDGLYNPQTLQGDIVVDGIRASTYTTAVEPVFAHAILTPLRAVYRLLGFSTSVFNDGSSLASVAPSGAAAVC